MRKGKLGFSLTFYPVVGFLLAIFGQWLLCFLVLGLAMVVEKDEWTTRQCMQASFLALVGMVVDVISGFFSRLTSFLYDIGSLTNGGYSPDWYYTMSNIFDLVSLVLRIAILVIVFVFALISVFKVARGQEANTPIVSGFAYKLFGMLPPKPAPVQYAQQPVYQQSAPMQQQPMQQQMPQQMQQQPMQPMQQQPAPQQPAPTVQQPVYPQQPAPQQPAAPVQQPPQNGGQMPPNV